MKTSWILSRPPHFLAIHDKHSYSNHYQNRSSIRGSAQKLSTKRKKLNQRKMDHKIRHGHYLRLKICLCERYIHRFFSIQLLTPIFAWRIQEDNKLEKEKKSENNDEIRLWTFDLNHRDFEKDKNLRNRAI